MRAGKLRHSIYLQAPHTARGSMGGASEAWNTVAGPVAASIEPLNGRELFSAQQVHSEVTVRIRLRYRAGIEAGMRAVHGGLAYHIVAVINPGLRNAELQLMCSQGRIQSEAP